MLAFFATLSAVLAAPLAMVRRRSALLLPALLACAMAGTALADTQLGTTTAPARVAGHLQATSLSGWTPAQLSPSPLAWYRSDIGQNLVSSTHISAWADKRGGANPTITQATDSARPTVDTSVTLGGHASAELLNSANSSLFITTGGVSAAPMTVFGVVQIDETTTTFHLLSAVGQTNGASFGFGVSAGSGSGAWWAGGNSHIACQGGLDSIPSTGYTLNGAGDNMVALDHAPHLVVATNDGTTSRLYIDDQLALAPSGGGNGGSTGLRADSGYAPAAGFGLIAHATGFTPSSHVWEMAVLSRVLSATERRELARYAAGRYGSGLGYAAIRLPLIACGIDSLTYGTTGSSSNTHGVGDWPTQMSALLSRSANIYNLGIPGRAIGGSGGSMGDVEQDVAGHSSGLASANIFIDWSGTNDALNGGAYSTAGYENTLMAVKIAYWQAIQAAAPGVHVIATTLHHVSPSCTTATPSVWNAFVDRLNALIVAQAPTYGVVVVDIASNPNVLDWGNDGLHLLGGTGAGTAGATGYAAVATMIASAVNAFL